MPILPYEAYLKYRPYFRDYTCITSDRLKNAFTTPIPISQFYNPKYFPQVRNVHLHKLPGTAYPANGNASIQLCYINGLGTASYAGTTLNIGALNTDVDSYAISTLDFGGSGWQADTVANDYWGNPANYFCYGIRLPTANLITGSGDIEVVITGTLVPKFFRP